MTLVLLIRDTEKRVDAHKEYFLVCSWSKKRFQLARVVHRVYMYIYCSKYSGVKKSKWRDFTLFNEYLTSARNLAIKACLCGIRVTLARPSIDVTQVDPSGSFEIKSLLM